MNSFPLLRLPQSVQHEVIQNMDSIDHLSLSICSMKTKTAVKNINLNLRQIDSSFGNHLTLYLEFGDRPRLQIVFIDAQNNGARHLDRPQTVQFFAYGGRALAEWGGLNLGFGSWIRHLLAIYSGRKLVTCEFNWDNDHYDVGSIKRCLNGINIRMIYYFIRLSEHNFQLLLSAEIMSDCVKIFNVVHQNELGLRKLLGQNLTFFEYTGRFLTYFSSLSNILAINSRTIIIDEARLSDKDLNRFLKLWKTGSMPRLEYMRLSYNPGREIEKDIVFKGLDHDVIEQNQVRQVEVENMIGRLVITIRGGYDVTRVDRVKAVIHFFDSFFFFYLLR